MSDVDLDEEDRGPQGRWTRISCEERETLIDRVGRSFNGPSDPYCVISSLTDLSGTYGEPYVLTVWGTRDGVPLLKDERWPGDESRGCQHHEWTADSR